MVNKPDYPARGLVGLSVGALVVTLSSCDALSALTQRTARVDPPVLFEDASNLLDFVHISRPFGGGGLAGAAWFDFDNDGWLDLFLTNGQTRPNALYHNNHDGTFSDVAVVAGVDSGLGYSGVVAADVDNNGFKDLFLTGDSGVTGSEANWVALYSNNGDGTFTDITAQSGILAPITALSAAFADIDNDSFLDLFITAPGSLATDQQHRNRLYRNNGDGTFTDISASSGVDSKLGACAALFTDYNSDGSIDLFVANCNDVGFTPTPIELYRNNGDLTFTDVAEQAGVSAGGFWMGFGAADYDNDGDVDLFVTNTGNAGPIPYWHALYENNCNGTYTNVAGSAGAAEFEFGWGVTFTDLDNDGDADIFFTGSLSAGPLGLIGRNPGTLLVNNQDNTFTDGSPALPVDLSARYTSGVAYGDYDNDGFVDLVVAVEEFADQPGTPVLLHNLGNGNHWLTVRLQGTVSNRDAVGARVQVTAGNLTLIKEIYAGSSFLSTDSQWPTFGLAAHNAVDHIRVRWPSGLAEQFQGTPANQLITLVEGQGKPTSDTVGAACP